MHDPHLSSNPNMDVDSFDVGLGLEDTHVLVTGAGGQIGRVVTLAFLSAGCYVTGVDVAQDKLNFHQHPRLKTACADTTNEADVESVFESRAGGRPIISCCVAVAGLDLSFIEHHDSMAQMSVQQFRETCRVNIEGTFITARAWLRVIRKFEEQKLKNVSLIIFGSEAGSMGVRTNADYSVSKAALMGLVKSLAPDVGSRGRVNLIAPGAVDTPQFRREVAEDAHELYVSAQATVAQRKPVPVDDVARTCLFLASDRYSGSITGQEINVNAGKSGKLFHLPDGTPV